MLKLMLLSSTKMTRAGRLFLDTSVGIVAFFNIAPPSAKDMVDNDDKVDPGDPGLEEALESRVTACIRLRPDRVGMCCWEIPFDGSYVTLRGPIPGRRIALLAGRFSSDRRRRSAPGVIVYAVVKPGNALIDDPASVLVDPSRLAAAGRMGSRSPEPETAELRLAPARGELQSKSDVGERAGCMGDITGEK